MTKPYDFPVFNLADEHYDKRAQTEFATQDGLMEDLLNYEAGRMTDTQIVDFFQKLINSGLAWKLTGHYEQMTTRLITMGLCQPAEHVYRFYCSFSEIERAHKAQGGRFFDPVRGWSTTYYKTIYHGCLFITSDRIGGRTPNGRYRRGFSIRRATASGDVVTVGKFGAYKTFGAAQRAAKDMVVEGVEA